MQNYSQSSKPFPILPLLQSKLVILGLLDEKGGLFAEKKSISLIIGLLNSGLKQRHLFFPHNHKVVTQTLDFDEVSLCFILLPYI